MAKTAKAKSDGKNPEEISFEDRLERLEDLGEMIRKPDIPLDEALTAFEEGIVLAKSLEKELEKIETKVEKLMNGPGDDGGEKPALGLFDEE